MMNPFINPFSSKRNTIYSKQGMVATSQPLAAQVGLDILKAGGNAIDAAIATAAALTVVEPTSNGIGGDAFALIWYKDKLHGLNASGPAPSSISAEKLIEKGLDKIPKHGVYPITVPGAPAAWVELSEKFGDLPFHKLLQPAIDYAKNGYPVSPTLARFWHKAVEKFKEELNDDVFKEWFRVFAPQGRAPKVGEVWSSEGHANTLKSIAETKGESFYRGELAKKMATTIKKNGGYLNELDLNTYRPEWVQPISVNYKGYDIWEIPPNGHGVVALMALKIFDKKRKIVRWQNANTLHDQIESMKVAFTDGMHYITDSNKMGITVNQLLTPEYIQEKADGITDRATIPRPTEIPKGGTVYLSTADKEGNMVSFIQSNYMGFGSGVVIPGTGISMQNRGYDFSLDSKDANYLEPNKKSYHTIIPGFLTKDGRALGPFGVMGGYMQPQGHFQVISNLIDFKLNPQANLDMPRWQWTDNNKVLVESKFPQYLIDQLIEKGHDIVISPDDGVFGRGQMILRDFDTGVLQGGTESRTDGHIAAW